jgi:hypothetical protein
MYSEGEKADPKRRLKLLIRVIFLIVVVVVLFAPVWEIVVGVAEYEVVDEGYYKETDRNGVNYTFIYIRIRDLGSGGVYHIEFHAQNITEELTTLILEPHQQWSFRAILEGAHVDSVSYTILPPDVKVNKSLFQILIGL